MKNHLLAVSYETFLKKVGRPPSNVSLLYGNELAFGLSLWITAQASSQGKIVAVVDGCNRFNVHTVTRFARQHKVDPYLLLNRIFLSRGFTCYQMEAVMTERLPKFLRDVGSTTALIFGLLDTFYDEQAPFHEVTQILRRIIAAMQKMCLLGTSFLLVSQEWNVHPAERNRLFHTLKSAMDHVYKLEVTDNNTPRLFIEHQYGTYGRYIHSAH